MCDVTTFNVPACGATAPRPRRPLGTSHDATEVPCQDGGAVADGAPAAAAAAGAPKVSILVCVPAVASTLSVFSSVSQVMCSRPGSRMTPAAPYALHCSPAASSFAG